MNAIHAAPQSALPRTNSRISHKRLAQLANEGGKAPISNIVSARFAVLLVLLGLSFSMFCVAGGLIKIGDDKKIPAKVRTKISQPVNQYAFVLTVISALQAVCVVALLTRGQSAVCQTQSGELSSALENLDISRLLKKRETLSTDELVKLVHEISVELKQTKTFQRYLIEKASHVVCTLDCTSRFISVSRASLSAWGYSNAELEGNFFTDYVEDGAEIFKKLMSVKNTNEKVIVECKLRARDGESLDFVWTAYWSNGDNALFCVAQDVTERKRNEQHRREFIAMVTHDLKTPIASLQGILGLLDNGVLGTLDPKGKQMVSNVTRDFERLNRLINDMLELERTEAVNVPLECSHLSMAEIVNHAADMVGIQAADRGIRIETYAPSMVAWGDRDQLVRVILNLVSNAVKFSRDNAAVQVRINDVGDKVRVAVIDSGRGIPRDRIDAIFGKFEQAKLADAKRSGGTGLGLAICKAIVQKHGGEIGVRSNEGCGSEFWFTVPKETPQRTTFDRLQTG
jgi:PAS domain S-box-containing protein